MDIEERLIEEVSNHPILYDSTQNDYKDYEIKNEVWEQITKLLLDNDDQKTVEFIKTKWKGLRDTFVKYERVARDKSRVSKRRRPWRFERQMNFLLPFVLQNKSSATTVNSSKNHRNSGSNDETESIQKEQLHIPAVMLTTADAPIASVGSRARKHAQHKRQHSSVSTSPPVDSSTNATATANATVIATSNATTNLKANANVNATATANATASASQQTMRLRKKSGIVSQVIELIREKRKQQRTDASTNDIDSFFKSIGDSVKKLSPINQMKAQKDIFNLVLDYRMRQLQ